VLFHGKSLSKKLKSCILDMVFVFQSNIYLKYALYIVCLCKKNIFIMSIGKMSIRLMTVCLMTFRLRWFAYYVSSPTVCLSNGQFTYNVSSPNDKDAKC